MAAAPFFPLARHSFLIPSGYRRGYSALTGSTLTAPRLHINPFFWSQTTRLVREVVEVNHLLTGVYSNPDRVFQGDKQNRKTFVART
jgi:hypothetical protein